MNVRHDSYHIAGWKRADALQGCDVQHPRSDKRDHVAHQRQYASIPAARPGDVWVLNKWDRVPGEAPVRGAVVGYAFTCPNEACDQGVHGWDHARDCPTVSQERLGETVSCSGCWTWTGSPEDDTLTGSPSLHVAFGCGWHGWMRNGVMVSV